MHGLNTVYLWGTHFSAPEEWNNFFPLLGGMGQFFSSQPFVTTTEAPRCGWPRATRGVWSAPPLLRHAQLSLTTRCDSHGLVENQQKWEVKCPAPGTPGSRCWLLVPPLSIHDLFAAHLPDTEITSLCLGASSYNPPIYILFVMELHHGLLLKLSESPEALSCRITESFRLEKPSKTIQSNHAPTQPMPLLTHVSPNDTFTWLLNHSRDWRLHYCPWHSVPGLQKPFPEGVLYS